MKKRGGGSLRNKMGIIKGVSKLNWKRQKIISSVCGLANMLTIQKWKVDRLPQGMNATSVDDNCWYFNKSLYEGRGRGMGLHLAQSRWDYYEATKHNSIYFLWVDLGLIKICSIRSFESLQFEKIQVMVINFSVK